MKGVGFLRIDISLSGMAFKAERNCDGSKSIRVPLTSVDSLSAESARKIVLERLAHGPYRDARDLYERVKLDKDMLQKLARAGAFDSLQERWDALYKVGALVNIQPPAMKPLLSALPETPPLSSLSPKEQVVWDYDLKRFNEWGVHVIDLMRQELLSLGATPMERLPQQGYVTTAGKVVSKQRPLTAKEYAFYVIEDGPLRCQSVGEMTTWQQNRDMLIGVHLMLVTGWLEKRGKAWTIRADKLVDPFESNSVLD